MKLSAALFDYVLPPELIAQTPALRRDQSRLLVVHRASRALEHRQFSDLPEYLRAGDRLFRNDARVLPARLQGKKTTGGQVECFLLRPAESLAIWWCLLRPGKRLRVGESFTGVDNCFEAKILEKTDDGNARVSFETEGESIVSVANRIGQIPLPPYIERTSSSALGSMDRERYQTVYSNQAKQVAVAAPTAGLHFTPEMVRLLESSGISQANITLHVALGTFRPIQTEFIEDHPIHRETYEVPVATQQCLFGPGGRRVAVGTTSVRTLEHFSLTHGSPTPADFYGETNLYLFPPATFKAVDVLITNFHQPRSTLLCLVSAFLTPGSTEGISWLKEIYREAIEMRYRFFSYGDAMLIL